jgi:tRNA(Ile)-lysidine synthase
VALGHTRDDQAETVLFRILRGSGLRGLAGIHPATGDGFVRPLIDVTRAEIEDYLRAKEVPWREDATNRDSRFARNRIRHGLLPQLASEWNPRISEALAQLADLAYEEERWWPGHLPDLLIGRDGGIELEVNLLAALPRAIARRVVREAVARAKGDLRRIEFQHIERIIDMEAGRLRLPGIEVTRSFEWVRLEAPDTIAGATKAIEVMIPGTYIAPDGRGEIQLEAADESLPPACANLKSAARLELRTWRPGDHYRPVGKSRDQKVKEMFQNARVPSWQRRLWPILEGDGEILWARQLRGRRRGDSGFRDRTAGRQHRMCVVCGRFHEFKC